MTLVRQLYREGSDWFSITFRSSTHRYMQTCCLFRESTRLKLLRYLLICLCCNFQNDQEGCGSGFTNSNLWPVDYAVFLHLRRMLLNLDTSNRSVEGTSRRLGAVAAYVWRNKRSPKFSAPQRQGTNRVGTKQKRRGSLTYVDKPAAGSWQ